MQQVFWVKGRINRLTWWIVQIGVFTLSWFVNRMFSPTLPQTKAELLAMSANPAAMQHLAQQYLAVFPIFLVTLVLTNWLFVTSSVLRLHDRDNAGWRVVFAYVPYLVLVASLFSLVMKGGVSVGILGLLMGLVGIVISWVWLIIECGILPGDESANDYGETVGAAARRAQLKEELQAMMGESGGSAAYEPSTSYQESTPAPQPAISFASSSARPSFGKR
jgi:uncharacterized membrane protein YhaH (DUF805 family)